MSFFQQVLEALHRNGARCVVVGGLAVNLHGHVRATIDLDLVVDLAPAEAGKVLDVLAAIGLAPAVPVELRDFADAAARERWVREKNMLVFPLRDASDPLRRVDLFVRDPIPFDELWERSVVMSYLGTPVRAASIDDLIAMKREAGRPQDLADIEALEEIRAGDDA